MDDLSQLSDADIAEEVRAREVAYQEGMAEIERRRTDREQASWSEDYIAACLAQRRADRAWHPRVGERHPTNLPPPMFRMGYEWAFLTVIADLERILEKPSEDIHVVAEFEFVKDNLYRRKKGPERTRDSRRRAAFDMIAFLEQFAAKVQTGMLAPLPPRKAVFKPGDEPMRAVP